MIALCCAIIRFPFWLLDRRLLQILNSDETGVTNDCNTSSWDASLAKADGNPYLW